MLRDMHGRCVCVYVQASLKYKNTLTEETSKQPVASWPAAIEHIYQAIQILITLKSFSFWTVRHEEALIILLLWIVRRIKEAYIPS